MSKEEFLDRLREALQNELDGQDVYGHLQYYRNYIDEQTAAGRTEEEVLEELGDPWVIAKSVTDAPNGGQEYTQSSDRYVQSDRPFQSGAEGGHTLLFDTWWKKLLLIAAVVVIIVLVISVVLGIVKTLLPIVLPVVFIVWLIKKLDRKE